MPELSASSPLDESAKEQMPAMGFLEHLEELRKRIVYSLIAIVVGFFTCWGYAGNIYTIMQRPIMDALQRNGLSAKLVYVNPVEPFNLYLKVGMMAGLFVASPFVLYQIWCFISPGLYRNEKRYVMPFMASTIALFLSGGYFGYKIVLPQALVFLIGYGKDFQPMITLSEYSSLFLTIIVGLGVIFEMPIVIFFLALMGIVSAGWMWRNIRYAILGIFVVAAIITPTPDILNMCIFAAPMVALYVLSIAIAWLVHPKQRRKRAEKKSYHRDTENHREKHENIRNQNGSAPNLPLSFPVPPVVKGLSDRTRNGNAGFVLAWNGCAAKGVRSKYHHKSKPRPQRPPKPRPPKPRPPTTPHSRTSMPNAPSSTPARSPPSARATWAARTTRNSSATSSTTSKAIRSKTTPLPPTPWKASSRFAISSLNFPAQKMASSLSSATTTPTTRCAISDTSAPTTAALHRHPARIRQPTAPRGIGEKARWLQRLGSSGLTAKKRCGSGPTRQSLRHPPSGREMGKRRHA